MPEFDPSLGCTVRSTREREKIAEEMGLADIRNWDSRENIKRDAERYKREKQERDTAYMDPLLDEALTHIERDEEIPESLGRAMDEAREEAVRRHDDERDRARQEHLDREAERNERLEWERRRT